MYMRGWEVDRIIAMRKREGDGIMVMRRKERGKLEDEIMHFHDFFLKYSFR